MSLVDYASSSDDDVNEEKFENPQIETLINEHGSSPSPIPSNNVQKPTNQEQKKPEPPPPPPQSESLPPPDLSSLPDASSLLNSPNFSSVTGTDHASRVAAAMAESASRKRQSSGLTTSTTSSSLQRTAKVPKGNLAHSRNVPDTGGGLLLPPQLTGRSNIVTEDIGKLFVKKNVESSKSD